MQERARDERACPDERGSTFEPPIARRRRLRPLGFGLAAGLCVAVLAAAAGDLADRFAGDDPLRARVRRLVTSSSPYLGALDLARTSPVIREALGSVPRVDLDAFTVDDDATVTRLRFALRLDGDVASGRLDVVATLARDDGAVWIERRTFTRDGAPPVDLTVTLPAR